MAAGKASKTSDGKTRDGKSNGKTSKGKTDGKPDTEANGKTNGMAGLDDLGLSPGEKVRWQRKAGGHWQVCVVIRREADGSVAVHDPDGAWRSIPVERLEAPAGMRRGRILWEPLSVRLDRPDQLSLWR